MSDGGLRLRQLSSKAKAMKKGIIFEYLDLLYVTAERQKDNWILEFRRFPFTSRRQRS
jgi:hypothetical protein